MLGKANTYFIDDNAGSGVEITADMETLEELQNEFYTCEFISHGYHHVTGAWLFYDDIDGNRADKLAREINKFLGKE